MEDLSALPCSSNWLVDQDIEQYYEGDLEIQAIFKEWNLEKLLRYSLPYLSFIDMEDENDCQTRRLLMEKAKDRFQPEWYCLMHLCHHLNGQFTFPLISNGISLTLKTMPSYPM